MELFVLIVIGLLVALILMVGSVIYLYFFRLWFRTHVAQCSVPLKTIFALFFRKASPHKIINAYIRAHKAGISLALDKLEVHYKEKGDLKAVVDTMIAAQDEGRSVAFEDVCARQLQTD